MPSDGQALPFSSTTRLHARVTGMLARRVIEADRAGTVISFPKEAELCLQLGVSRSILREAMKVLVDKGMVEMKPRAGTRSKPRTAWRLLDPAILGWQAELAPDAQFLRDLCEVRLAIEPTAAGFAAVRATDEELRLIKASLDARREAAATAGAERLIEFDLAFQSAIVNASHNALLMQLSESIRQPFRVALAFVARFPAAVRLSLDAHEELVAALQRHDPLAAKRAAEEVVGFAMLAVEKGSKTTGSQKRKGMK